MGKEYEPIPCPNCGKPTDEMRRVLVFSREENRRWEDLVKSLKREWDFYFWDIIGSASIFLILMQMQLPVIFPFFSLSNPFYPASGKIIEFLTVSVLGSLGEWNRIAICLIFGVVFFIPLTFSGVMRFKRLKREKRELLAKYDLQEGKEEYVVR